MKLKLNKIIYFLNWFPILMQLYSNLFNVVSESFLEREQFLFGEEQFSEHQIWNRLG